MKGKEKIIKNNFKIAMIRVNMGKEWTKETNPKKATNRNNMKEKEEIKNIYLKIIIILMNMKDKEWIKGINLKIIITKMSNKVKE